MRLHGLAFAKGDGIPSTIESAMLPAAPRMQRRDDRCTDVFGHSGSITQSIQSTKFFPGRQFIPDPENRRNLRMPQSRGFERPGRSRSQHWNPGGASCLSSTSVAQMLAAASIKVMDALFGFLARNDAEWTKRELLGRTWRRDWGMRYFS